MTEDLFMEYVDTLNYCSLRIDISYKEETGVFFYTEYHKSPTHGYMFCNQKIESKEQVLSDLIRANKLNTVFTYYDALNVDNLLDSALATLAPTQWDGNDELNIPRSRSTRYELDGKPFAVHYNSCFYATNESGQFVPDFEVVKVILANKESVMKCQYNFYEKRWDSEPLIPNGN